MSSLTNKFISDWYTSELHTEGSSLSASSDIYDGFGNKSSLSIGLDGNGATVRGSLTAGNVVFPSKPSITPFIDIVYPIGSIYLSTNLTDPSNIFGGSWRRISEGRFIVGVGSGFDSNNTSKNYSVGADVNGVYSYSLTVENLPEHYHYVATPETVKQSEGVFSFVSNLNPSNYLAYVRESSPAITTFDYAFGASETAPSVGRTSSVGGLSGSAITSTPPSFGAYIWERIS
jgi:hypothetical protein